MANYARRRSESLSKAQRQATSAEGEQAQYAKRLQALRLRGHQRRIQADRQRREAARQVAQEKSAQQREELTLAY